MQEPRLTRSLVFAIAALFLCIGISVNAETLRPKHAIAMLESGEEPLRVVAFGDSITGVYYHTGGRRAWCAMLGEALRKAYPEADIQMFNAGISGNTSGQGLARIDHDVIARKPHLVVVMFGMNDATRHDIKPFRKNCVEIVKRCRAAGAEVVLCTPNNVYPNKSRPQKRLAKYAQTTRDIAAEMSVPLVDFYQAYKNLQRRSRTNWALLMSEVIHPNMNGHRLFAEMITEKISGKPVSLDDVGPPNDALAFTLARLRTGKPVKIVAMEPYDKIVPELLRERFPDAEISVVTWPVTGQSLTEIETWANKIRGLKPNLVMFAIPGTTVPESQTQVNEEAFVRKYTWALALCCGYGHANHDVVPVLPSVTGPIRDADKHWESLAKRAIRGYDFEAIACPVDHPKTAPQIVAEWIEKRR